MTSGGHKKHSDLVKPGLGNFGRNEWAFLGTKCDVIKNLAGKIIEALSAQYQCGYVDAAHNDEQNVLPGRLGSGACMECTDNGQFHQVNIQQTFNRFDYNRIFSQTDLVLVNGNHHQAKAQVVIIDTNKIESLKKRAEQLTNVEMILIADNATEVFDFVKTALPHWNQLPVYQITETEKIIAFFRKKMQASAPVLNGLVLAGGKSLRMGHDKSVINWHGKEQRYYAADMLKAFCKEVFISCREDQVAGTDAHYPTLADTFTGLGPYGAILSAFRQQPDTAWLVIACDLPLLDAATLNYLVENRCYKTTATAYKSPYDNLPEPLVAIWEPKSYPLLLSFLAQGYSCPRKVLINSNSNIVTPLNPDTVMNINTPDDAEKVKKIIEKNTVIN